MNKVTVTAKSYDEAVTNAQIQLQTTNVEIKTIQEGTAGLFGVIGGKQWIIEASIKEDTEDFDKPEEKKAVTPEPHVNPKKEETVIEKKTEEPVKPAEQKPVAEKTVTEKTVAEKIVAEKPAEKKTFAGKEKPDFEKPRVEIKPVSPEKAAQLQQAAKEFLAGIFNNMEIAVTLETGFNHDENELDVIMSGDDMGMLIGKRGQTLDSLQYLTSLVVNKQNDGYIRVKLDTENYRERREEKLEILAQNVAAKVKRTKRKVELEPMNPYERRIIHSALQSDPMVTTLSEGEEPYRRVVVILKKDRGFRKNRH